MRFVQNKSHAENSAAAIRGEKPEPAGYESHLVDAALVKDHNGRWLVVINHGLPMPATDVEVSLWLRLQQVKK